MPQPTARMEEVNVLHSQIFKKVPITYSAMPQNSRGQNKGTSLNIFRRFFPITYSMHTYRGSVAGSVIQATGRMDFEDGPRIGNQSEDKHSLQRVRIIPENKGIIVLRGGWTRFLRGQTKVQPAKFRAISGIQLQLLLWCKDLNWPRR